MPVVVRKQPETRVVAVPGLDGCTVTVREPTLPERINQWWDSSKPDGSIDMGRLGEYRLRVVVGWNGFEDEETPPNPLPFSQSWLLAAMAQYPTLHKAVGNAVAAAFNGLEASDEKNFEAPHGDGLPAAESAEQVAVRVETPDEPTPS